MGEDSNEVTRRSVLKRVGAGSVAGVATMTTAETARATDERIETLESRYDSAALANGVVRDRADGLLSRLAATGFATDIDAAELETDSLLSMEEYADGAEGTFVSAVEAADGYTPRISVRKRTTDGDIVFALQPETDEQFAIVRPTDGDPVVVDSRYDDVTTQTCSFYGYGCEYYHGCLPDGAHKKYEYTYCTQFQECYREYVGCSGCTDDPPYCP